MSLNKMHDDEVETSASLVRRLLAAQFPQWAKLPITAVSSSGTDNALYRLGDALAVRLPRIHWAADQVEKDLAWLPRLAPHVPLTLPAPLAQGDPDAGYPYHWGIYRWLAGENLTLDQTANPQQTAVALAQFITTLQQIDGTDGPPPGSRGAPLAARDGSTRAAIAALAGMIDTYAVTQIWEAALQAPAWTRAPVWFHGDLMPGNLLFTQGQLTAVIDFACAGVGDPACDWMVAWNFLTGDSRQAFRAALPVDEATWARGRGWALSQALIFIPYYLHTNPVGVATAWRTLHEILADHRDGCG